MVVDCFRGRLYYLIRSLFSATVNLILSTTAEVRGTYIQGIQRHIGVRNCSLHHKSRW